MNQSIAPTMAHRVVRKARLFLKSILGIEHLSRQDKKGRTVVISLFELLYIAAGRCFKNVALGLFVGAVMLVVSFVMNIGIAYFEALEIVLR